MAKCVNQSKQSQLDHGARRERGRSSAHHSRKQRHSRQVGIPFKFKLLVGPIMKAGSKKPGSKKKNHRDLKRPQTGGLPLEPMPCQNEHAHHHQNEGNELVYTHRMTEEQQLAPCPKQAEHKHTKNHPTHAHGISNDMTE